MRRAAAAVAFGFTLATAGYACNAITGANDLSPTLRAADCTGCSSSSGGGGPDGGMLDGQAAIDLGDGAIVSDAQKDGDDLTPGGFIDGTWGTKGITTTGELSYAYDVAVASDGKVYVVGPSGNQLGVVRFGTDGKVDPTFGVGGLFRFDLGSGTGGSLPNVSVPDPRAGIAIDSQDRVLVGGTSQKTFTNTDPDSGVTTTTYERYLFAGRIANGALDTTFGQGGTYTPNLHVDGEGARAVAIAPGDGLYLVGSGPAGAFTVWRLTSAGNADPAFGQGGRAVIDVPSPTPAWAGASSTASVFAAGGSGDDFAVGRLTTTGAPGFADGGPARVDPGGGGGRAWAVAVQTDGKIVVGGTKATGGVRSPIFALARVDTAGALDTTFGTGGIASFDWDNGGTWRYADEELRGLVLDSRGRIVVTGWVEEKPLMGPPLDRVVVGRLTAAGALDSLFGTGGKITFTDLPKSTLRASAIARAPNGSLIIAGNFNGTGEIFVVRIIP